MYAIIFSTFNSTAQSPMASISKEDKQGSSVKNVAVIGAGVSGLSAAYKLKLQGLNVTVFEADGRVGGKLRSISRDGLIWDEGANTMTESEAPVGFLLDNLGLRDKQQFPLSQQKRYIAKDGVPVLLPSNPVALIKSNFLSAGSKLQIFLEPFLWKSINASKRPDEKESVGAFFQRHFGKEVVDYLIDPFVAGTSGGDPESLSMQHVFPEIWNLEKRYGSIISGAIQSKLSAKKDTSGGVDSSAKKKQKHGSFSFLGGMQTLTNALCNELSKDELKLQSKVLELACSCSEKSPQDSWSISYELNDKKLSSEKSFDALIVTAPLSDIKQLKITKRGNPFLLDFIPELVTGSSRAYLLYLLPSMEIGVHMPLHYEQVNYLPMSVIITTFKRENVKRPLEGFGVLIPSKEQQNGLRTLGTLFSSMMFPDRAPSDVYLYTTFVGGSRNRELAKASSDELKQIVTSDLRQLLGAEGEPAFLNHYYWSKAFPSYGLNYGSVIQAIDKMEKELPGLYYAGNHKGGLSVGKAISSGCQAADLVISYLDSTSDAKGRSQ
ncbi:protoporphyrinogen oxidase, mitochondrial isoform X1 [Salvia hispanica]|uniref:protoporphyrinogen oxidase, mitochondrial isoform X1 n=1 Tax=Salvia hispanica TaxID=49212 RepID=UPI002009D2E4|nr:protoporphyrinogen oxidase, mitochondrial isoform X1 [Salvia hispanica]XP_047945922.1 protoporphyrinogen oxidase, mitochondrial isoform X1 [Salvia hispanica]XP_047945923.1 protoporphyrinogen oxidase, mitochondrial isoform X1 [Salvia hispanica]XP_047945924.1 protoporphyrinogen oxidase, mitochondrial isoform X1 [Salvia hispanica]